ncbi:Lrp/AsnC family transcriptional regulator [Solimonas flava]|uniref:Lrp/AsnC family transcriptional regulator n=1 Tax=Solimonas flava TaxID=415849 RepID=UPI0004137B7C|nr:Lrp/AsnC family transcriptional regulator [Solimonas flava]
MSLTLDTLDLRIAELLQRDATLPIADIAERVASSKTVVWRRIQRLVEAGAIRERVALLDHEKLGFGLLVFAHIKMARHGRDALPKFIDAVKLLPQVIECHTLMGDVDFLLKILVRDIHEYEHFIWQKLSQIDGVQDISSSISMSQPINTTRLPLKAR